MGRARDFGLLRNRTAPGALVGRSRGADPRQVALRPPRGRCIGAPGLKERGWTEAMIRALLGDPDLYADNPNYKSAAPMRLWRLQRAEAIEGTPEFAAARERAERQCAAARKGAELRQTFKALAGLGQPRPGGYGTAQTP